MKIYTLNVGQGQFVVVVGESEAFIVDTYIPLEPKHPIINVKGALATILKDKNLIGLMVTGFDADHFNAIGMKIVLNKYRPNWIMYPKYFKKTQNADACFAVIKSFENSKSFDKKSVALSENTKRFYNKLSSEFVFEVFSPHTADMNSSNNCSLVCKVKERSTGVTYLITGDTENDRWDSIVRYFKDSIKADVLDAPHHGSKNGISKYIKPHTVIVSAGVENQYGHPDKEAKKLFDTHAKVWHSTNHNGGQSIVSHVTKREIKSYKFEL